MSGRSLTSIDTDLSEAVKARASATDSIRKLSDAVIWNTRKIDQLLAERATVICPDTPATLAAPAVTPAAVKPKRTLARPHPLPPAGGLA